MANNYKSTWICFKHICQNLYITTVRWFLSRHSCIALIHNGLHWYWIVIASYWYSIEYANFTGSNRNAGAWILGKVLNLRYENRRCILAILSEGSQMPRQNPSMPKSRRSEHSSGESETSNSLCSDWPHYTLDITSPPTGKIRWPHIRTPNTDWLLLGFRDKMGTII